MYLCNANHYDFYLLVNMRKLISITITGIILLLASCKGEQYPSSLQLAHRLTYEDPDSAVLVLKKISGEMAEVSDPVRRYYQLLCIRADDKTDQMNVSPDSIQELVHYFEKEGDKRLLPTAYYYAGRVYSDLNIAPISLTYFQKALDAMEDDEDTALKGSIYSQMGYLYLFQYIYDEAEKCFRNAYALGVATNDTTGVMWSLRDLGATRQWQGKNQESINYLEKARKLAQKSGNMKAEMRIDKDISFTLTQMKKYKTAKLYMQEPYKNIEKLDSNNILFVMANAYYYNHETDSFLYCAHLLEKVGDVFNKEDAYKKMTATYLHRKENDKAREAFDKYIIYNDSMNHITKTNELQKVHFMYNLQKKEEKNQQLERAKQIRDFFIIGLIIIFLSVGLVIYNYIRHKQKQNRERISKLQMLQQDIKRKNETTIIENNKKITELEQQMSTLHEGQQRALEQLEAYKKRYQAQIAIAEAEKDSKDSARNIIKASSIYQTILKRVEDDAVLNTSEWQQVETMVNDNYPQFRERLFSIYDFSSYEYHLCLLTKMGISPYQIATLTAHTKSAVTHTRKRLYKKCFREEGTGEQWDEFIHSL